jgi:hypothetical protein
MSLQYNQTNLTYEEKLRLFQLHQRRRQEGNKWAKYVDDPVGFVQEGLSEFLWSKQREIFKAIQQFDRVAVKSCHSSGKALVLNTRLPTPRGFTSMGDVGIGDMVLSELGVPITVLWKSEIHQRPCYELTFDDKTKIIAADDHLWSCIDYDTRDAVRRKITEVDWRQCWSLAKTATTEHIANTLRTSAGRLNWIIPRYKPPATATSNFSKQPRYNPTNHVIVNARPIGVQDVQCIEVDNPTHLFLVTDSNIPTHNSFSVSRLAGWWIASHKPGEAFVVSTAPTFAQVRAILWREINRVHKKGKLPGYTNQTEWFINDEMVAFGRKPDDDSTVAFQGIHARYLLVILDEACGVNAAIWNAAETLAANGGKIIAIGNPDDPQTEFKRVCDPGSPYHVVTISAYDTPNFTGEEIPKNIKDLLISKMWVDAYRKKWGETHPFYISKILGQFPDSSIDSLIPMSLVQAALEREIEPSGPNQLGVDVARMGTNESVIYQRQGSVARLYGAYTQRSLMEVVGFIVKAILDTGAERVLVDDVGMGGGVVDRLVELQNEYTSPIPRWVDIVGINVGLPPSDNEPETKKFANYKTEVSWLLRERFERGDIDLGDDQDTISQIVAMKYTITSRGWMKVASKEEMQKELAGIETDSRSLSPDRFDALVLAFCDDPPGDDLSEWRALARIV